MSVKVECEIMTKAEMFERNLGWSSGNKCEGNFDYYIAINDVAIFCFNYGDRTYSAFKHLLEPKRTIKEELLEMDKHIDMIQEATESIKKISLAPIREARETMKRIMEGL